MSGIDQDSFCIGVSFALCCLAFIPIVITGIFLFIYFLLIGA